MKNIIQRNLPLDQKYVIVSMHYSKIIDGGGTICENCGRPIANIAKVKNASGNSYYIGFDCMETFLLNNQLLDQGDIERYQVIRKAIPKVLRVIKELDDLVYTNKQTNQIRITNFHFEKHTFPDSTYFPYWIKGVTALGYPIKPTNSYLKLKNMPFDFLIETLSTYYKSKIEITVAI